MTRARIDARFEKLRAENRAAFVSFVTAGDPDPDRFEAILAGLPEAGADLIEVGMPFTDPMADGPAIQASGQRALKAGMTVRKTLAAVERFRARDGDTPIVLMGYLNPIHAFGVDAFMAAAAKAGVDGLIIVDCPPEEDEWACLPALKADLAFIRLATPTTDEKRLPRVIEHMSGFVYYVSIAGITGAALSSEEVLQKAVSRLKAATDLPVCIGFGIKSPEDAAMIARIADGAVVGSAIVSRIADAVDADGQAGPGLEEDVLEFVRTLSSAVRAARGTSA